MKMLFTTQYFENYGAHDWDGTGECPQYWKPKGGSHYVMYGVDLQDVLNTDVAGEVEAFLSTSDDYCRVEVIDWELFSDFEDEGLTEWELESLRKVVRQDNGELKEVRPLPYYMKAA